MISPSLPIRDALRGLRNGLAAGREAMRPFGEAAPKPLRGLLRDMASQADSIGRQVERTTAELLRSVFEHPEGQWTLERMAADPAGGSLFADRLYWGLKRVLTSLSLPADPVSEVRASHAFENVLHGAPPPRDTFDLAAALILCAEDEMFAPPLPFARRAAAGDRRLALFAVMLWLLADRLPDGDAGDAGDEGDLLQICTDAASALGREIAELPEDRAAIRKLLADYARLI